jgi:hypothetical protein
MKLSQCVAHLKEMSLNNNDVNQIAFIESSLNAILIILGDRAEADKIKSDIFASSEKRGESLNILPKKHNGIDGFLIMKPVKTLISLGFNIPLIAIRELFPVKTYVLDGKTYGSSIFVTKSKDLLSDH